jgi:glc operon protein GlcG
MRCSVGTLFAACAALCVAGQALAQAPTPAPAPSVPDQMSFDIPYGPAITADHTAKVVAAAVEEAKKSPRNWKLAIAVDVVSSV